MHVWLFATVVLKTNFSSNPTYSFLFNLPLRMLCKVIWTWEKWLLQFMATTEELSAISFQVLPLYLLPLSNFP